jgi:hypothetical protein
MDLDLETFLITLYVITDDWYQKVIYPQLPASGGPAPKLCDSEVLCLALAAQWRSGVPWKTERGLVRNRPSYKWHKRHKRHRRRVVSPRPAAAAPLRRAAGAPAPAARG